MRSLDQKEYNELVDNITVVTRTDLNGVIVDANEKFCDLSGFKKEELIGKKARSLAHPSVNESFHKEISASLRKNQIWHGVFKNINKMGDTYYLRSTIYPVINKNNKKIGYIAIRYLSNEEVYISDENHEVLLEEENLQLRFELQAAKEEIEALKEKLANK